MRAATFFFTGLVCLGIGPSCSPPKPTAPDGRVWLVSPPVLIRSYLDRSERWTNCRVCVVLDPGTYRVDHDAVLWYITDDLGPATVPAVVFECPDPPRTNTTSLTVVGVCRGCTRDGKPRSGEVNFCVRVTECLVTVNSR